MYLHCGGCKSECRTKQFSTANLSDANGESITGQYVVVFGEISTRIDSIGCLMHRLENTVHASRIRQSLGIEGFHITPDGHNFKEFQQLVAYLPFIFA